MGKRGERQALRAANELATLLQGEALFTYCSPYKRTKETWNIIESYLRGEKVEVIGMREEPRVAEQQFGNFRNSVFCHTSTMNPGRLVGGRG
jgi:broad specificity phosphatase PhoE